MPNRYPQRTLQLTPSIVERLYARLTPEQCKKRFDPERFNLEEVAAHFVDFDNLALGRIRRVLQGDTPTLPGVEPDDMVKGSAEGASVADNLAAFRKTRLEITNLMTEITDEQMSLSGCHPSFGTLTVENILLFIGSHDIYHIDQITQILLDEPS